MKMKYPQLIAAALVGALAATSAVGQEGDQEAELAKKLQNPVAALISVPFQNPSKLYVEGPTGAFDWGIRFAYTLLFPK